jgi:hypothetical protein
MRHKLFFTVCEHLAQRGQDATTDVPGLRDARRETDTDHGPARAPGTIPNFRVRLRLADVDGQWTLGMYSTLSLR